MPVPASTVDRWTHPPFAGHVDEDGWIWGRGAADCKNTLLAILGAVERLVEEGFEPERTILLAFGHVRHPFLSLCLSLSRARAPSFRLSG